MISLQYNNTISERNMDEEIIQIPINECKVIFLGDGDSGKTYSLRRLLNNGEYLNDFYGEQTPGIEIRKNRIKTKDSEITVNYWDFGGHEIYYSMHRMFLTEQTVYVVFLNARLDDLMDERARYWMENIKPFAPYAPVLVVINKIDQNEHPRFNEKGFMEAYGNQVKKIIRLSAKTDKPQDFLDKLQKNINNIIMEMPTVNKRIPISWKNLMEDIRAMEDDYLTKEQFIEKCKSNGIKNYKEIYDELVDLLQVLGVGFCYYKDRSLADYMLLNPKWMLNALYTIVTNGKRVAVNGVITQNDLFDLLQKDTINGEKIRRVIPDLHYKGFEISFIIGVIRMFSLSYSMKGGSEFFPMLCDGDEKISVKEAVPENALHFIFRYKYLPSNIMHYLIVEMQRDLDYRYVWYTGAIFRDKLLNQTAFVHSRGNALHIYVYGEDKYYSLNVYMTLIIKRVRNINNSSGYLAEEFLTYRSNDVEAEIPLINIFSNIERGVKTEYNSTIKDHIKYSELIEKYIYDTKDSFIQLLEITGSILDNAGYEILLRPNDKSYSCRYDVFAEKANAKYCIDIKVSTSMIYRNLSLIDSSLELMEKDSENNEIIPVLFIFAYVSDNSRKEVLDRRNKVKIIDIANILYAIQGTELHEELVSLLPFSIDKISLKESNPNLDPIANSEEIQEDLIDKLDKCDDGRVGANKFEIICSKLLKEIYSEDLSLWKEQPQSNLALYRFDLLCRIKDNNNKTFWSIAEKYFHSKYIIFEFKNYSEAISQKEIYTTEKYLYKKALRNVAIIIAKNGFDDNSIWAAKGCLRENGKLILLITVKDLKEMYRIKRDHGDPSEILLNKIDSLLIELEK